jgi:hypothetical protein
MRIGGRRERPPSADGDDGGESRGLKLGHGPLPADVGPTAIRVGAYMGIGAVFAVWLLDYAIGIGAVVASVLTTVLVVAVMLAKEKWGKPSEEEKRG